MEQVVGHAMGVERRKPGSVYTVPTDAPEADGTGLGLHHDGGGPSPVRGHTGTGWTYGPPACAAVVRDQLAASCRRGRPRRRPAPSAPWSPRCATTAAPGVAGYAISAVDVALWDLKARLLGLPLHRLLGAVARRGPGLRQRRVHHLRRRPAARAAHRLGGRQRIPRVKIKIGESWGTGRSATWPASPGPRRRRPRRRAVRRRERRLHRASRRSGSCGPPPTATCAGSRSRCPPTTSTGCARSATRCAPTSPPGEYGCDLTYFRADVRRGRRRLPAGRRLPLRRHHRMAPGGRRRRRAPPGDLRALRPAPARPRRGRRAQPAAPGVVPRPRPDRGHVLRRHPRPDRRRPAARPDRARPRPRPSARTRRAGTRSETPFGARPQWECRPGPRRRRPRPAAGCRDRAGGAAHAARPSSRRPGRRGDRAPARRAAPVRPSPRPSTLRCP